MLESPRSLCRKFLLRTLEGRCTAFPGKCTSASKESRRHETTEKCCRQRSVSDEVLPRTSFDRRSCECTTWRFVAWFRRLLEGRWCPMNKRSSKSGFWCRQASKWILSDQMASSRILWRALAVTTQTRPTKALRRSKSHFVQSSGFCKLQ